MHTYLDLNSIIIFFKKRNSIFVSENRKNADWNFVNNERALCAGYFGELDTIQIEF